MSTPHKILYLITSTNLGGTEKALYELTRKINRQEFKISVCSLKKPGLFAKKLAAEAEAFYSLNLPESGGVLALLKGIPGMFRLIRLIRFVRPAIIHCLLFRANVMGRIAGRIAKVPIIISSIRVIESNPFKLLIDCLTSPLTDYYIAVSDAVRDHTITHVKIPPNKIVTIHNGIDIDEAFCGPPSTVGDRSFNTQGQVIALIGRFHKQKGHTTLIQAVKLMLPVAPDIKVLFVGEGPLESRIRRMVEEAGLSAQVQFLGPKENISQILQSTDIVVLPSLWEGLPNIILEAMAKALPVVASRIEGMGEMVVDGKTGILVVPGDPRSLADALLTLIKNKSLAEQMGKSGREYAAQKFPMQKTIETTEKLYRYLLQCSPQKRGG